MVPGQGDAVDFSDLSLEQRQLLEYYAVDWSRFPVTNRSSYRVGDNSG